MRLEIIDNNNVSCVGRLFFEEQDIDKLLKMSLSSVRMDVSYPGFRKGKVPDDILLLKFKDKVAKAFSTQATFYGRDFLVKEKSFLELFKQNESINENEINFSMVFSQEKLNSVLEDREKVKEGLVGDFLVDVRLFFPDISDILKDFSFPLYVLPKNEKINMIVKDFLDFFPVLHSKGKVEDAFLEVNSFDEGVVGVFTFRYGEGREFEVAFPFFADSEKYFSSLRGIKKGEEREIEFYNSSLEAMYDKRNKVNTKVVCKGLYRMKRNARISNPFITELEKVGIYKDNEYVEDKFRAFLELSFEYFLRINLGRFLVDEVLDYIINEGHLKVLIDSIPYTKLYAYWDRVISNIAGKKYSYVDMAFISKKVRDRLLEGADIIAKDKKGGFSGVSEVFTKRLKDDIKDDDEKRVYYSMLFGFLYFIESIVCSYLTDRESYKKGVLVNCENNTLYYIGLYGDVKYEERETDMEAFWYNLYPWIWFAYYFLMFMNKEGVDIFDDGNKDRIRELVYYFMVLSANLSASKQKSQKSAVGGSN